MNTVNPSHRPGRILGPAAFFVAAFFPGTVTAQEIADRLDEALAWQSADGAVRADLSVLADVTLYAPENPPPGLLFADDDLFLAPSVALFLDAEADDLLALHVQARVDRGFDPGERPDGDARLDAYHLDWRPWRDGRLQVRAGKSPTVFGSWAPRHLSWDNPLVTAPLFYEDMLPINDRRGPGSVEGFAARRDSPENKAEWVPAIWGASYATGLTVFGATGGMDYALELKNAALSSRPDTWDAVREGFPMDPTVTGRLGWRPVPEWTLGTSFSYGPYLREEAEATLPSGSSVDDYAQTTAGIDAAFAHGRWQWWAELFYASFDVPRVGHAQMVSGYVEARYKMASQWWAAARWNQSWFDEIPGRTISWDRDAWRLDLGIGWRCSTHLQAKVQYSIGDQAGNDPHGRHLLGTQVSLRF